MKRWKRKRWKRMRYVFGFAKRDELVYLIDISSA
jgi:hypothetical protein